MIRVTDPYNAVITWLDEPCEAPPGPARGHAPARQGPDRHRRDPHDVRLAIYGDHVPETHATVVQRVLDAGAVVVGKANLPEFAWGVLGAEPLVRDGAQPASTRARRPAARARATPRRSPRASCDLGSAPTPAARSGFPSAACETVGLKSRWGADPAWRASSRSARRSTPSARWRGRVEDVALLWSVLDGRAGAGAAARRAHRRPAAAAARSSATAARPRRATWRRAGSRDLERLGARVVEARDPRAVGEHLAALPPRGGAESHRATFPSPRRRVLRHDPDEARSGAARRRRRGRGGVPRARGVAALRARRRPLRRARAIAQSSCRPRTRTSSRCGCASRRSCAGST